MEQTNEIIIQIKQLATDLPLPAYMTAEAAGMDLYAAVTEETILLPGQIKLIPTGIAVALPAGYELQIRPRSGLALRHGVTLLNSPGTVDADYRGEIGVIMVNFGEKPFVIRRGDRIAQMVCNRVVNVRWRVTDKLTATPRGAGGFGHTGY